MERCKDDLERKFEPLIYQDTPRVQPVVAQSGWSHHLVSLQHCIRKTRTVGARSWLLLQCKSLCYPRNAGLWLLSEEEGNLCFQGTDRSSCADMC
jgi:hypothetical protein